MATPGPNGSLDFEESIADVAPSGIIRVARRAGALQQSTDGAAYQDLGGASVPTEALDWFAYWKAWAQTIVPTLVASPIQTEFQESSAFTLSVFGTGAATILADSNGGVLQLNTGATAASFGKAINLNGTTKALVSNARTQKYAQIGRIKVLTNPAGTARCVLLNMTDENTADCALVVDGTLPTVLSTVVGASGAVTTGIAHGNAYAVLAQIADGTNVKWYVNQTLIATIAQSGAANAAGRLQMLAGNGDQSANTEFHTDKLLVLTENP